MSEVEEIVKMIREQGRSLSEVKESLARIEVHNEYSKTSMNAHDTAIKSLESSRDKQRGALWLAGGLGGSSLLALVWGWIKNHIGL